MQWTFLLPALKIQQCQLLNYCVSECFHFVFYRQSLRTPQDFCPRKTASEASGLCRRTRKKISIEICDSKQFSKRCFKTVLRRFYGIFPLSLQFEHCFNAISMGKTTVVLKQFYVDFMGIFLCHYSLNIVLMRNKSQWDSHLYRGWDWNIKFFEPCLENATMRNIQWLRFRLIPSVFRSRISSPPGTCFLCNKFYIKNLRVVKKNREERSHLLIDPSKSWLWERSRT